MKPDSRRKVCGNVGFPPPAGQKKGPLWACKGSSSHPPRPVSTPEWRATGGKNDPMEDLQPPHSKEAETAVLGAILLDNKLLPQAREVVRDPAAFYSLPPSDRLRPHAETGRGRPAPRFRHPVGLHPHRRRARPDRRRSWISSLIDQAPRLVEYRGLRPHNQTRGPQARRHPHLYARQPTYCTRTGDPKPP